MRLWNKDRKHHAFLSILFISNLDPFVTLLMFVTKSRFLQICRLYGKTFLFAHLNSFSLLKFIYTDEGFSTADVVMYHYYYCVTFLFLHFENKFSTFEVQIIFYFMSDLEVFDVRIASKSTDQAQLFCTLFAPVVFVSRVT